MSSNISIQNFLSQKYIFEERYNLNKRPELIRHYSTLKSEADKLFFNQTIDFSSLSFYANSQNSDICQWFLKNISTEAHYYDFSIPMSPITPLDFYFDVSPINHRPWKMILFIYSPYTCDSHGPLTHPTHVQKFFQEKEEEYLPKSFFIEDLELGWICYDDFDTFTFVHHIQLKGKLKSLLNNYDLKWFYRFMARSLPHFFSKKTNPIIIPTASMYDKLMKRATKNSGICIQPYSERILGSSGFKKIDSQIFDLHFPGELKKMILNKYLTPSEIEFWRYP